MSNNAEVKNLTEPTKPSNNYFVMAEQAGKALTIIAATLLLMSVSYDYSYMNAIGLSLYDIPSLTTEHVRSAIVWGPALVLSIFGGIVINLIVLRLEDGQTDDELMQSATPAIRTFRKTADGMRKYVFAATLISTLLFGTNDLWMYNAFLIGWGWLSFSIATHPRMGARFNRLSRVLFCVLPCMFALVCLFGYSAGARLVHETKPAWELTLKSGTSTTKQVFTGLRRFSSFALAVDQNRFVSVLPNESIVGARRLQVIEPERINVCRWFGLMCVRASETNDLSAPTTKSTTSRTQ
jgi:hypothetical protein